MHGCFLFFSQHNKVSHGLSQENTEGQLTKIMSLVLQELASSPYALMIIVQQVQESYEANLNQDDKTSGLHKNEKHSTLAQNISKVENIQYLLHRYHSSSTYNILIFTINKCDLQVKQLLFYSSPLPSFLCCNSSSSSPLFFLLLNSLHFFALFLSLTLYPLMSLSPSRDIFLVLIF